MRNIIGVSAKNFLLECEMENGDIYEFDMSFVKIRNSVMTKPLHDKSFFNQVFIELGALSWPNGYEIHADTVVRDGRLLQQIVS